MIELSLTLKGLPEVVQDIKYKYQRFDRISEALTPIVEQDIEEHFEYEETPDGIKWLPLEPKYSSWKERWFPGRKMQVLYGTLKAVATNPILTRAGNTLYYTLNPASYAGYIGVKRREFWGLSKKAQEMILQVLNNTLNFNILRAR